MRKILEDLYYSNITPGEQQMAPNSELRRTVSAAARLEHQLLDQLSEAEQTLLCELMDTQHKINSITALENFILGFRLGVRLMVECMEENDGDITEVIDHG